MVVIIIEHEEEFDISQKNAFKILSSAKNFIHANPYLDHIVEISHIDTQTCYIKTQEKKHTGIIPTKYNSDYKMIFDSADLKIYVIVSTIMGIKADDVYTFKSNDSGKCTISVIAKIECPYLLKWKVKSESENAFRGFFANFRKLFDSHEK